MIVHLRHPLHECPALGEAIGLMWDGRRATGQVIQFADGYTAALKWPEIERLQEGLILPEDQLRNVARILLETTEVTRPHNGRGRPAGYAGNVDEIAQAGRQLAEMILDYIDGVLIAVDNDTPF
jgi:hypothetical protein